MKGDQIVDAVIYQRFEQDTPASLRNEITQNLNGSIAEAVGKTDKMDFMAVEMTVEAGMALDGELARRKQIDTFINSTGALLEYFKHDKDLQKDPEVSEAVRHLKDRFGTRIFELDSTERFTGKPKPNRDRAELVAQFDVISQTDLVHYMEQRPERVDTSTVTDFTETALVLANAILDRFPEEAVAIHSFALKESETKVSVTNQINSLKVEKEDKRVYFAARAALNARAYGLATAAYISKVNDWNSEHPETERELEEISRERLLSYMDSSVTKEKTAAAMIEKIKDPKIPNVSDDIEKDATLVSTEVLNELLNKEAIGVFSQDTIVATALAEFHDRDLNRGIQIFAKGFKEAAEAADPDGNAPAKGELYNLMYRASAAALVGGGLSTLRFQQDLKRLGLDGNMGPVDAIATISPDAPTAEKPYVPAFNFPPERTYDEIFAERLRALGKYYEGMHAEGGVVEPTDIEELVREVYVSFRAVVAEPEKTLSRLNMTAQPPKTS